MLPRAENARGKKASLPSIRGRACRPPAALDDYRVVVERSAEKDLRRLPLDARFRVADALRTLSEDPQPVGSRKLVGTKHDWRIRVGTYRVIYEIADSIRAVRVYRVRHRRDVYR